ncbi:hypothetical protein ATANTOWER_023302 [Ataeniobius toweri]|uniref:Uncharacterized protein n=1 Tax=Ataeniobius toweri TaxID=208326 RepID=A0ABU7A8F3_9TELE|nr:hypothetical protein [Ataeniobius toweri]
MIQALHVCYNSVAPHPPDQHQHQHSTLPSCSSLSAMTAVGASGNKPRPTGDNNNKKSHLIMWKIVRETLYVSIVCLCEHVYLNSGRIQKCFFVWLLICEKLQKQCLANICFLFLTFLQFFVAGVLASG